MCGAHRHVLSKNEAKEVVTFLEKSLTFKVPLSYKSKWEVMSIDGGVLLYLADNKPIAMKLSGRVVPLLTALIDGVIELPKTVVDMGAVKHIVNGADVMAPGITRMHGDFSKGDLVVIVDERYEKPLCVGLALFSKAEIETMSKGKVIKNLHYVGDKIWVKLKGLRII
ncbi:MAG: RNA-binding protein [Candidatus Nezhaarchaeota archaeon]|nr:RNA-binding protein [Candidatus Nezhaarchaeota archaeon]MCX8141641.1 RNA-binding protein [Candidatus Nezhaarchaeota archaeon]MDW8049908.1 RNA-binding protein [Nitrososphaerota archaeon]